MRRVVDGATGDVDERRGHQPDQSLWSHAGNRRSGRCGDILITQAQSQIIDRAVPPIRRSLWIGNW